MSPLANIVKETANLILPHSFHICWKNIVEVTPWYLYQDFARLLPVSPDPKNRLEKAMRWFYDKTDKILQQKLAHRQGWYCHLPHPEMVYTHHQDEREPDEGQFDDEDLGREVFDPLETPTVTPVQDKENVTMTLTVPDPEGDQKTASSQEAGVGDAPSSQDKCCFPTFTSPSYCQEEIASQGEPEYPSSLPELLSHTPGNTPRITPKMTLRTTPKTMPQASPNRPSPKKPSLRGHTRGAGNSPSGKG